MYFIDIIWEILKWIWENRNKSFSFAAITSLLLILIDKFGRKLITNQLKRLFHVQDKSEFAQYKANQIKIMENQRLMMEHMGVKGWDAHSENTSKLQKITSLKKKNLLSLLAGLSRALTTGAFTTRTERSNHSKTRGEFIPMRNYLKKLSRTKLQAFLLATIMNIALLVGYVMDVQDIQSKVESWMPMVNMAVQTILTLIYVWVEGSIDKEQAKVQKQEDEVSDIEKSYHGV